MTTTPPLAPPPVAAARRDWVFAVDASLAERTAARMEALGLPPPRRAASLFEPEGSGPPPELLVLDLDAHRRQLGAVERRLRESSRGQGGMVLLLGDARLLDEVGARLLGVVDDLMAKPVSPLALALRVQALLRLQEVRRVLLGGDELGLAGVGAAPASSGEAISAFAHDLRSPLGGILLNARALEQGEQLGEFERESLAELVQAAESIERRLACLVDLARGRVGERGGGGAVCSLTEVVREATDALRPLAQSLGGRVLVSLDESPPPIAADGPSLTRALMALTEAALIAGGGRARAHVHLAADRRGWRIEIEGEGGQPVAPGPGLGCSYREVGVRFAQEVAASCGGQLELGVRGAGFAYVLLLPRDGARAVTGKSVPGVRVPAPPSTPGQLPGRVLVLDDDPFLLAAIASNLRAQGHDVHPFARVDAAMAALEHGEFDVFVQDVFLHGAPRLDLPARAHDLDPSLPVVLISGRASVDTAIDAVRAKVSRMLLKPLDWLEFRSAIGEAVVEARAARSQRSAGDSQSRDLELGATLDRALDELWLAWQPIVSWRRRRVVAYESLLRSDEPAMPHPGAILPAVEQLDRIHELGRRVRAALADGATDAPPDVDFFVNLHPRDLLDPALADPDAPLSRWAERTVLEVTERAALEGRFDELAERLGALRSLGFRIAVDDLGSGYAGLNCLAMLKPDVAKLDMTLVRNLHQDRTRQRLVGSMAELCEGLGIALVAEGVEVPDELFALVDLGCDLLQGYHFLRPQRGFGPVSL